jgi:DNA-binding GntR family transcriptional regulator
MALIGSYFSIVPQPMTDTAMDGIKKYTYGEQVAEYIKEKILQGQLQPGDQVKEVALSSELSISRAPIREALQILSREGLIVSKPQKGKFVAALTAKQIKESYFTGGILEAVAVSQALHLYTNEDIDALESIVNKMRDVSEAGISTESLADLDNRFHGILFSRVDNELLIDLCRRSCQGISKFLLFKYWIRLFTPKQVYERHLLILNAIKSGDTQKVEKIIRQHYQESGTRMAKFGVDVIENDQRI